MTFMVQKCQSGIPGIFQARNLLQQTVAFKQHPPHLSGTPSFAQCYKGEIEVKSHSNVRKGA
jgi:hypothetical protein